MKLALLTFLLVLPAGAAVVIPSSNSSSDVQTAINNAASGDTVMLIAGSNAWASTVTISNKSLWLKGYPNYLTTIKDERDQPDSTSSGTIEIYVSTNQTVRLSDFNFYQTTNLYSGVFVMATRQHAGAGNWIVQRSRFINLQKRAIAAVGYPGGLVSSNYFNLTNNNSQQGVMVLSGGHSNWQYGPTWGSANRTYIEGNVFDFANRADASIEGYQGAEFTVRFNWFTNCVSGMHGLDTTAWSAGGSCKDREFYGNLTHIHVSGSTLVESRGGCQLCYSNIWLRSGDATQEPYILLECYRSRVGPPNLCSTYEQGCADATSPYDGNLIASNAWPVAQSIGVTGPYIGDGYNTNAIGTTNTLWTLSPSYEWQNYSAIAGNPITNNVDFGLFNVENAALAVGRDFTNDTTFSYTAYPFPHPLTDPEKLSVTTLTVGTLTIGQ